MNKYALPFFFLFLGASLFLFSSCGTTKKPGTASTTEKHAADFLFARLNSQRLDAEWLDAKAKIAFADNYFSVRATAQIRLQRDSAIWISLRKLGFEAARVLILPDSVHILDRLNNEYAIYGLDYLGQKYNLPASFAMIQDLLLGNAVWLGGSGRMVENGGASLILIDQTNQEELRYQLDGKNYHLQAMTYLNKPHQRSLAVTFEEYNSVLGRKQFAYFRNFKLSSEETGPVAVDIQFTQVEFNVPTSFPFEVPGRFTRVD